MKRDYTKRHRRMSSRSRIARGGDVIAIDPGVLVNAHRRSRPRSPLGRHHRGRRARSRKLSVLASAASQSCVVLLWEETSRKKSPSRARSTFGCRAFASSLEGACAAARASSVASPPVKVPAAARGVCSAESFLSIATLQTSKPSCSLANAGTILLSGPRGAMASFGSPEGHSLLVGTSGRRA